MGEHEGWSKPVGLLLNGVLPGAGSVFRALDAERWFRAEERTGELIDCIQPNPFSEERRNAVAAYVQQLIMTCFRCQVFTFGSVPLKTYLPDGDIDLTVFSHDQNLKDIWANQVRDMLQNEEKNENAEFHVKEVQYIQAEVKIIKCLVENIVVDISFNQVGGLCTLCFLDEVDHLIGQNHLFKRSIILIKAWCYYESRILGATHGLISTYALETLVLYIFHVFNNSFHGPLEVLYHFLEFFSNFDWDRYCLSLWGPVPINSLPDMTAEPPRKDNGDLLLSKSFLDACSSAYSVFPAGQENNGQHFVSKHFNVIDPLRVTNNLGRSVSKGNFYRIRSAFAFGAKRLARLLDCPKGSLIFELNQFFMNTWERHGSGRRPDAAGVDSMLARLPTSDVQDSFNSNNDSRRKRSSENHVMVEGGIHSHGASSHRGDQDLKSIWRTGKISVLRTDEAKKDGKINHLVNESHGKFLFARTRSSPELTDACSEDSSLRQAERSDSHGHTSRLDTKNRVKNLGPVSLASHTRHPSSEDTSHGGDAPLPTGLDGTAAESNGISNMYLHHLGLDALNEELPSTSGGQENQEEQTIVNMMAAASLKGFGNQLHMPYGLSSTHVPFAIPPSFLAAMGYTQRNLQGFVPSKVPLDPSFSNPQYRHGFVSPQLSHFFPGMRVNSPSEASSDQTNGIFSTVEMKAVDVDDDLWHEQGVSQLSNQESDNGNFDMHVRDHKPRASVSGLKYIPPSRQSASGNAMSVQQKHMRERSGSVGHNSDTLPNLDDRSSGLYAEERSVSSRFSSASHSNSSRSRTSLEGSWDGSYVRTPKSTKGKKPGKLASAEQVSSVGKGRIMGDNMINHAEAVEKGRVSSPDVDEATEVNSIPENVAHLQIPRQHLSRHHDIAQTSAVESMVPVAPMLIGPGLRENTSDCSEMVTFYPAGPPIPFLTMLPFYNIPETGNSDAATGHFAGDENSNANESAQNFNPERFSESEVTSKSSSLRGGTASETSEMRKTDILNSDIAGHLQNLQFGRFCQNPLFQGPLLYPSPIMAPPVYLPGRLPYDNSGSGPPSTNINIMPQIMTSYGNHLVPVAPVQPVASRPLHMYQHHFDDIPRYRSGTGTYLPNPKVSVRDRHPSVGRRGSYKDVRTDPYGDRVGNNWNANSKARAGPRSHNRSQIGRLNLKVDSLASNESGTDGSLNSYRHESAPSYQLQNGPLASNSSQNGCQNISYGTYPLATVNPNAHSNGPVPPFVMLFPFGNNATYGAEPLEFGSLGPVGVPGAEDQLQFNEGNWSRAFEDRRHHGNSGHWSSPDQPSSPHYQSRKSRDLGG